MIILLYSFLLLIVSSTPLTSCPYQQQTQPEHGSQFLDQLPSEHNIPCIQMFMKKGWTKAIDSLQHKLSKKENEIVGALLARQIKKLQIFEEYVVLGESTCEPVVKWAQSLSHLFIAVKLSHRWDSPPCSNTIQEVYSVLNQTLRFKNVCLVSNEQITFEFKMNLLNSTEENFEIKKDGVGTYSITIKKKEEGIWVNLDQDYTYNQMWEEVMMRNRTFYEQFQKARQRSSLKNSRNKQPKNELFTTFTYFTILILILQLIT